MNENKKILIICYYYPPNSVIPSWRPHSLAHFFSGKGYKVDVVCRYWTGNEKTWKDQTEGMGSEFLKVDRQKDNLTVHYLPKKKWVSMWWRFLTSNKFINRITYVATAVSGILQPELDAYFSFKPYLKKLMQANSYDAVIVSAPPMNLIRLGAWAKKYQKPTTFFVADFRDTWDNNLLSNNYIPTKKQSILNKLNKRYINKWLKNYDLITAVCKPIIDVVLNDKNKNLRQLVFTNGFEKHIFDNIEAHKNFHFTISSVGTIYKNQDYKIVADGIFLFAKEVGAANVRINLIGAFPYNLDFCNYFKKELPLSSLNITERIPRQEALAIVKNSHVLFYPGWANYKGLYSGKIFEYLGSYNNILIAPGDGDALDNLIRETNAGRVANTEIEVKEQLLKWYNQFKTNGVPEYLGNIHLVNSYTRQNQAELLEHNIFN